MRVYVSTKQISGVFCWVYLLLFPLLVQAQFGASPWTAANGTYTVPAGVTSITVECWGAGGGGGGAKITSNCTQAGGGGGGGGAYAKTVYAVTPGQTITVSNGVGGTAGSNAPGNGGAGGSSSVIYSVGPVTVTLAAGGGGGASDLNAGGSGPGGAGGTTAASTGSTKFAGGTGDYGIYSPAYGGGGGGGSGGTTAAGANGAEQVGGAGGASGGGNGGNGGTCSMPCGSAGVAGVAPGGGGGGGVAKNTNCSGGTYAAAGAAGAAGRVIITYVVVPSTLTIGANAPGAASNCRSTAKVPIQAFTLSVSGGVGDLTGVSFTTTGSYVQADITRYQLWHNSSANNLAGATQVGTDLASSGGAGARSFAAFSTPSLPNGTDHYFWITADISSAAVHNNTIACNAIATTDLTGASTKAGSSSAGGTQTIQAPTVNVGGAMAAICQGGTSAALGGSVGGTATGGTWSDGGAGGSFSPAATNLNATYTAGAGSGTPVTLTLTTSGGACGTTSANKNITVNPNPTVNAGGAMAAICQSATSAALGGSFGGGATAAVWSDGGAGGSFSNNGGGTPNTATYTAGSSSGSPVTLTLTTSGGSCGTASANKNITVNPSPSVAAIGGGAASVCVGGTTPAFTNATGGGTWSITNGTGSASITAGGVVTGVSAGSVTVNYAVTSGGCTTTVTAALTITAGPSITTQPTNQTICAGTDAVFTVAASGSPTYQWQSSANNSTWASVSNGVPVGYSYSGGTSASLTVSGSGVTIYYYRCVVTVSGCSTNSNSAMAGGPLGGSYSVSWPLTTNTNPVVTGNVTAGSITTGGGITNLGITSCGGITGMAANNWNADITGNCFNWPGTLGGYFQATISPVTCATVNVTGFTVDINDGFSSCAPHQNGCRIGYSYDGVTFNSLITPNSSNCWMTNGNGSWLTVGSGSINLKTSSPVDQPVIASVAYPSTIYFRIYFDQNNGGQPDIRNYIRGIAGAGFISTPLPVDLVSFTGESTQTGVSLKWETASEINNDYFVIERSVDGDTWKGIGMVKGAGNTSLEQRYDFLDQEPPSSAKTVYYRLKQTDYNGKYEHFGPISVQLLSFSKWEMIINNPVTTELSGTLLVPESMGLMLEILDLQGRVVKNERVAAQKGSNLLQMDIRALDRGFYFIRVSGSDNVIISKFVKE